MPKLYTISSTDADAALCEAFQMYGVTPQAAEDQRGRFYQVEIPAWWTERRREWFKLAIDIALNGERNLTGKAARQRKVKRRR